VATLAPPKGELGVPSEVASAASFGLNRSWASFYVDDEHVTELTWPESNRTYHQMRTDAQIDGLLAGLFWPILSYTWSINPNGADESHVQAISEALRLPVTGEEDQPLGRRRGRFVFQDHLRHAMLALVYGHMYFEQVGDVEADGMWQLRKLAPRMPRSIAEIATDQRGGLQGIRQLYGIGGFEPPMLPVGRLVAYIWDREGANWAGRSIFRSLFRHWVLKDTLLRVDAIKHERGGMGVPVIENAQGASEAHIRHNLEVAEQLKAGETGGASLTPGAKLRIQGVEGSLPDTLGSIIYHDQQMARRLMGMVISLGQQGSTGNRALGEVTLEMFDRGQQFIAGWFTDVFNEHVIEDIIDWNYGEATRFVPVLEFKPPEDPGESLAKLGELVSGGLVQMDPELEAWVRSEGGFPEAESATPGVVATGVRSASGRRRRVSATAPSVAATVKLRRNLSSAEVKAGFDPIVLEEAYSSTLEQITAHWLKEVQPGQAADLVKQISKTSSLKKLAQLKPTVAGVAELEAAMDLAIESAIAAAIAEAKAQGITLKQPALDAIRARVAGRAEAVATLLAQDMATSAGRAAIRVTNSNITKGEVAEMVQDHLDSLSDRWVRDRIGGALQSAINSARVEAFQSGPPSQIYASEILDASACSPCIENDEKEYASWAEAEADYPTGGFRDCEGGDRCRGTLFVVFDEAEPSKGANG
jgi:hypothetical protein